MAGFISNITKILTVALIVPGFAFGVQAPNLRGGKSATRTIQPVDANASIRRSATSVIARSAALNARKKRTVVTARPVVSRAAANVSARSGTRVVSGAGNVSRSAVSKSGLVRSAAINKTISSVNKAGISRAGKTRATAVFNDVTKLGGTYSTCRDAYATCMDQFCANANDTYRRCFCSDRFMDYRDTSDNLDEALGMLADFQNNNLNAVDKTTAEVQAMYSSTAGEDAIKKDTSASQKMLDEIDDILSGKKTSSGNMSSASLGVLDFGSLSDVGDIWSGSGSSIFNTVSSDNLSGLEGQALYQRAAGQCAEVVRDMCSGDAMFDLASSAYSVFVTQDCNAFEKSINAKKESIMQTIREAEKLLREARLEEYRAHNSQDVNECLARVEEAFTNPMACGENYVKCLDYTGEYINGSTGEPIYSPKLFNLTSIAPTLGDVNVVGANARWNDYLESKKMFVTTALDTCRSLSDEVWEEFKRAAVIRIAQAQEEKLQEVKDSCVTTIKDCYDETNDTLAELSENVTSKKYDTSSGRTLVTRNICADKVATCASLYGDMDGCTYDKNTRKFKTSAPNKTCGLSALLDYVNSVDSIQIAQGCETAVSAYAHELCTPTTSYTTNSSIADYSQYEYPAGCAKMLKSALRATLTAHAKEQCALDLIKDDRVNTTNDSEETALHADVVNRVIKDIFDQLGLGWSLGCEEAGGFWYDNAAVSWLSGNLTMSDLNEDFYKKYYGGMTLQAVLAAAKIGDIGACVNASVESACAAVGGDFKDEDCSFDSDWDEQRCDWLGGDWNGDSVSGTCTID